MLMKPQPLSGAAADPMRALCFPPSVSLTLSVYILHAPSHKLPCAISVILPLYLRPPLLLTLIVTPLVFSLSCPPTAAPSARCVSALNLTGEV